MTVVPGDGYVFLQHGTLNRPSPSRLSEHVAVDPGRAFTLHGLGFTEQASVMSRGRINDKGLAGMQQFSQAFTFHLSPFTFHLSPFTFHLSPSTSNKRSSLLWTKVGNANAGAS